MKRKKYSRNVELRCPTCAGTQFEHDDVIEITHATARCVGCGREMTKEDLIRENSENIDAHVSEIGKEVIDDFAKQMKKTLRKALGGSKSIKLK